MQIQPDRIGLITGAGPVGAWLEERAKYDAKYEKLHGELRELKTADRRKAEASGYLTRSMTDPLDRPPLTALAGWHDQKSARKVGKAVDEAGRRKSSMALSWFTSMAATADREHADDDKLVEELSAKMAAQGVGGNAQAVAGDASVETIREHLAANGDSTLGHSVTKAPKHAESL